MENLPFSAVRSEFGGLTDEVPEVGEFNRVIRNIVTVIEALDFEVHGCSSRRCSITVIVPSLLDFIISHSEVLVIRTPLPAFAHLGDDRVGVKVGEMSVDQGGDRGVVSVAVYRVGVAGFLK